MPFPRVLIVGALTVGTVFAPAVPATSATATPNGRDHRRAATSPWTSGIPISTAHTSPRGVGFWCTAGLPARKGRNTYLVTAGHCARMGDPIYTAWSGGQRRRIGTVTGTSARLDVAAIRVTNGTVSSRRWNGARTAPITGIATVRPGSTVCHNGARSRRVCNITVVDSTRDPRGLRTVYGRVRPGHIAARGGDSGGLVFDTRGRAVGIVSAISRDGTWIAWTPAKTALNAWGLTPITG